MKLSVPTKFVDAQRAGETVKAASSEEETMKAEKIQRPGRDRVAAPSAGCAGAVVPPPLPDGHGAIEGLEEVPHSEERSRADVDGA